MFKIKKLASLFLVILLSTTFVVAQTSQETVVTDDDLKTFASAFKKVQIVDQEAQQEMVKAVEDEGLSVQRFNELIQSQEDPTQSVNPTDEEKQQFENANKQLQVVQNKAQESMHKKIMDEGLSLQRYQEIAVAVQSSPELQQKLQQFMQL